MSMNDSANDQSCVNTIRTLAIDMVQQADSGHPGLPLGAAPMMYVLWKNHLRFDPQVTDWPDRDRFVLSPGHGSALLYALLHTFGFDLTIDDLKAFRQWGSRTPGHPEIDVTPGVEATTGPLGQGAANAVGMAMAERHLAHRFGAEVVDHHTYALISDGDVMEGISNEAASLAGHLGLSRLIYLYDSNDICLDGPTSLTFTEDVGARYEALGWHVQTVRDGDRDLDAIDAAIVAAKAETERPSLIVVKTTIGFGSPHKAGTADAHGSPLGDDEVKLTKEALGWPVDAKFLVPEEAHTTFAGAAARGAAARSEWEERFAAWVEADPERAGEWGETLGTVPPDGWDAELLSFAAGEKVATRAAGGKALNALAARLPFLWGGDADLSCSTKTGLTGAEAFDGRTGAGRNVHYGVREHAMGAIANGLCYHGGVRPFTATFFVFSDYMRPATRLAALNHLPVISVFTHDSVAVGEDGPTHEPIEHLASLRAMPNCHVVRPADANETVEAWTYAVRRTDGPTILVLSRQGIPTVDRATHAAADGLRRGAYVLAEADGGAPRVIVIGTGAEVTQALEARALLQADGIPTRVVSMPCTEQFDAQDAAYRESVLPAAVTARVSIEAGTTFGWERYVGIGGRAVGIDRFGASAPGDENLERFGMTAAAVVAAAKEQL